MNAKKKGRRNFPNSIILVVSVYLLSVSLLTFAPPTYADGFKFVKVDSHYEPAFHYGPGITLPGTNIKAGSFSYTSDGYAGTKLGFWINNKELLYVQSEAGSGEYDIGGEINYGIYKNYFVVDSWSYGAGHNRMMFLFRYNKDSVQLLDAIGKAYIDKAAMDFLSEYDKSALCDIYKCPPRPMIIKNMDQDANPEIKLLIVPKNFELYLEIVDEHLQVDLNPLLYEPLFERAKQKPHKSKLKPHDYYLYAFLSKKLTLEEIKSELKADKTDRYEWLLSLLENYRTWNIAFHEIQKEKPDLVKFDYHGGK